MNDIRREVTDAVMTVTIDREKAYNALNAAVIDGLRDAVLDAADDPAIRAVIVTGSGDKAFCAGADLKELAGMDADTAAAKMNVGQHAFRAIEQAPIPVIAAVNGLALGGGFELVLASTFPILSTRAQLGLPESSLGLIPGYGGTQRLPRAVGRSTAAHLMLTGARLDADRAHALGLTPLAPVAPDELLATARATAERIATQGPVAVRSILQALDRGRDADIASGLDLETGLAAVAIAGRESEEGIRAFLEKRPADFAAAHGGDDS